MMFKSREGFQIPVSSSRADAGEGSRLKPDDFKFWTARAAPCAPYASLSASILSNLGKPSASGGRTEPATGYDFPAEYCFLRKTNCPSLAGLGVRSKKIVIKDINVYALGIYVDASAAQSALSSFKKRPVEELEKDQAFYDAVVAAPHLEKTLRLVIASRLVDRRKFLEALEERLAPKLKEAGDPGALDAFRRQFDGVHFEKGLEIAFTTGDNRQLTTRVAGEQKGAIASPALVSSLFDIYLGADPPSRDAKSTFGHSLAAALAERK